MFDTSTRNRLATFVGKARKLLCGDYNQPGGEITSLLQTFGIQPDGSIANLDAVPGLDQTGYELGLSLRGIIAHKRAEAGDRKTWGKYDASVYDLIQEQGFTVLNRLCALRMAEDRQLILPAIGQGTNSDGFQLYEQITDKSHFDRDARYQQFLFSLFDELALDLGVLFDRFSQHSLLFPRPEALQELLELLNDRELAPLWAEDETVGWVYQYWNSKEERKAMRDASAAPRNSRELAVRNQFFTPRYVVEFLTDNTLGRIWYEMTQGATVLKDRCRYLVRRPSEIFLKAGETAPEQPQQENLSQEELLKQPVHIPNRPLKDPRTILMLDPACGSMHFGLYAFDLFEVIYAEAWDLEKTGTTVLNRPPGLKSLRETYADKEAFLRDVPRLIIEHNIHGIDIDPRAAQIAGLALWLRAQNAWKTMRLTPAERPAIKRSNIVCAEPMPGEKELLREFVEREFPAAERAVCLRLLEAIFDKMQLAGEAGSLLKIEEEIRSAIEDARDAWQKLATKPPELFTTTELNQLSTAPELTGLEQAVSSLTTDPRHLTTDFWERIEERIYAALRDYAEQAENGGGFQRRLFAEDAARGFAFIDVCRKRYDVAVMNPPFGQASAASAALIKSSFKRAAFDLFACFLERGLNLLVPSGSLGAITTSAGFYRNQIEDWRASFFLDGSARACADLGGHVLDGATVRAAAYVRDASPSVGRSIFVRCNESETKGDFLLNAILNVAQGSTFARTFLVDTRRLNELPGRPLAYWLPAKFQQEISKLKRFADSTGDAQFGLSTKDDFRFLRLAWEVSAIRVGQTKQWCFTSKGGIYSPFYYDIHLLVLHEFDFRILEQAILHKYPYLGDSASWVLHRENSYYQAGITFQRRTNKPLAPRALPAGCLFTDNGPSAFWNNYPLATFLALFNSSAVRLLAAVGNGALEAEGGGGANSYEVGVIKNIVVPVLPPDVVNALAAHATKILELKRLLDVGRPETRVFISAFRKDSSGGSSKTGPFDNEIELLTQKIDELVNPLYGFAAGEIAELLSSIAPDEDSSDEDVESSSTEDDSIQIHDKVSWLLGCSLGRWDIRYATGEQAAPELPDPFAPLPVCPPGQLQNAQGLPARPEDVPAGYSVRIPWDGILVDDPNHPLDIERRVREVIEIIWSGQEGGPTAEAIEHEACEILGVKSLRDYFRKPAGFFADHLKRYSKSRRQAPIYWPLSTASGSYTLWIYYHRLTNDTLYAAVTQFVEPRIEEAKQTHARLHEKGDARNKPEDKTYEETTRFIGELATFREELLRIAGFWKPNLNDGVLITAAPLWSLFALKPWQKKLKETWQALEKGDYDWAHLAYSIWPERVTKACEKDRSIAIAHGLEHLCKVEPPKAKKKAKSKAAAVEVEVDPELIGED